MSILGFKMHIIDDSKTNLGIYVNKYLNDNGDWVYVYRQGNIYYGICRYLDNNREWKYKYQYLTGNGADNTQVISDNNPVINTKILETISTFKNKHDSFFTANQNETVTINNTNAQQGYLYDITVSDI